jgi:hypothetical protein
MGNEDTNKNYQMFIDIISQIVRSHLEKLNIEESELIKYDEQSHTSRSVCESEHGRAGRVGVQHRCTASPTQEIL